MRVAYRIEQQVRLRDIHVLASPKKGYAPTPSESVAIPQHPLCNETQWLYLQ